MSQAFRIASGGRIDRRHPVSFTFDGKAFEGFSGDTLASALLANGVHFVGRSYKYHRPRGVFSAGPEEPNGLVTIKRGPGQETPNLRATQVELYDGLAAASQNRWPSLRIDAGAVTDGLAPLFSAGFYYKTFMGPHFLGTNRAWAKLYEPLIRRAAGLGRAPSAPDPDTYANRFAHCDVLVVGGGPAGLAAALAAATTGARVMLCDEQAEPGGALLAERETLVDGIPAGEWAGKAAGELARAGVTLLRRTQAFGYFAQNFVGLAERLTDHLSNPEPGRARERLWQIRAKQVVLATGAIERPLVFADNDRPGIMLADAARTYATRYGVRAGARAVVATACDTGYQAALDLIAAGVDVALIADWRDWAEGPVVDAARKAGVRIEAAAVPVATSGRLRVREVQIGRVRRDGGVEAGERFACDLLAMSGGWTPSVHLFSQSRGTLAWNKTARSFLPGTAVQAQRSAGACRGNFGLLADLEDGYVAGEAAARAATGRSASLRTFIVDGLEPQDFHGVIGACPTPRPNTRAFVDMQHDVVAKDIKLAAQEGFRSIEHIKRYTTTGMATDQGKTSNINALAVAAKETGKRIAEVGLTTFRQPYTPVTFGTLAASSRGELFDPVRRTPIDSWAQENDAVFEDVGLWKRARYFARADEDMHAAVARECKTIRSTVGIFDATTLGKIEVVGPDAAEFLERMYINPWKKLEVGRCRYGVLLNEAGFIIDDGVVGRMAADTFHVTTTTGGAPRVLNMMEDYLQTEFPNLKAWLTSTTEQWAVIAAQGPRAREMLAPLVSGFDLSAAAFPHMGVREGAICGVEARIFRVSFTGETGFEINVPADYGRAVWEAVWSETQKQNGCAYGTEAMHVLRAEKGFIIVGQETDGTVTPDDVGLAWAIGKRKEDFVGKRSLARPDMVKPRRRQLVGLKTADPRIVLEEGAQITGARAPAPGTSALGYVTSSYWSEPLGHSIALGLVAGGRSRMVERLSVPVPGGSVEVEVVSPVFIDPAGERLNA